MNLKNSEGYLDPTAMIAMNNVMKQHYIKKRIKKKAKSVLHIKNLKLCYVASRLSGDIKKNIEEAKYYCKCIAKLNMIPVASHIMYPAMGFDDRDLHQRLMCRVYGLYLLSVCDEMYVFMRNKIISEGMREEIKVAKKLHIPIKYFNVEDDLNECVTK